MVKKSYKEVTSVVHLNNLLAKKKTDFIDQINKLEEKEKLHYMSINELKEHLGKTTPKISFFKYTQRIIDELHLAKRFGNERIYKCVYQTVKKFHPYEHLKNDKLKQRFEQDIAIIEKAIHTKGVQKNKQGMGTYRQSQTKAQPCFGKLQDRGKPRK